MQVSQQQQLSLVHNHHVAVNAAGHHQRDLGLRNREDDADHHLWGQTPLVKTSTNSWQNALRVSARHGNRVLSGIWNPSALKLMLTLNEHRVWVLFVRLLRLHDFSSMCNWIHRSEEPRDVSSIVGEFVGIVQYPGPNGRSCFGWML